MALFLGPAGTPFGNTEHVWIGRFINLFDFLIKSAKQCELIRFLQIRYGKEGREAEQNIVLCL